MRARRHGVVSQYLILRHSYLNYPEWSVSPALPAERLTSFCNVITEQPKSTLLQWIIFLWICSSLLAGVTTRWEGQLPHQGIPRCAFDSGRRLLSSRYRRWFPLTHQPVVSQHSILRWELDVEMWNSYLGFRIKFQPVPPRRLYL